MHLLQHILLFSTIITWCLASECRLVCPNNKKKIYPYTVKKSPGIFLEYKTGVINVPVQEPQVSFLSRELEKRFSIPLNPEGIRDELMDQQIVPQVSLRMPEYLVDPVPVTCKSRSFLRDMKVLQRKIKCTPRPTIVEINSSEGVVVPSKVETKQCSGLCRGGKICQSVAMSNFTQSVKIFHRDGSDSCAVITVPQDTRCRCKCATNKRSCNSLQIFDNKLCKCKCTNKTLINHCAKKANITKKHRWDDDSCSCVCKETYPCTTGTTWDKTNCRCNVIKK